MRTFQELLKIIEKEYNFSACFIADHLGLEDEIVENWEQGKSIPNQEQAEKFADTFALPRKVVLDTIEKGPDKK